MKQEYRRGIDKVDKHLCQRKYTSLGLLLMILAVLLAVPGALAVGNFPPLFNLEYNTTGTRIDASSCIICHTGVPVLNDYGKDLNQAGVNPNSNDTELINGLTAIEQLDSDGDGFNNIVEINARFFPGNSSDHPATAPTATPIPTVTPKPTAEPPKLILTLNATMDGGNATVNNFTNAVLRDITGITKATATLPDNMTAQFNLTGLNPGDYFIEVNHLAGDRVPTRIDSNESDINQSVGTRLRNSIIGNISDPTYRIKARSGGMHPIVNYITGTNEAEVPFIIVSANPAKIELHEMNTSRGLTNFTPTGNHPTGESFQTWILGSDNHGINYNGTDARCSGCHGNLSKKSSTFEAITTNNGWCYRCHFGKDGDGNGFVDPMLIEDAIPPVTTASVIENSSYNNSVNVTLNATDNPGGSGVNETYYMVNNGPTATYSAPFVVDNIGPDNVTYWSTDMAGNVEAQNMVNFTIVNISVEDIIPPVTTTSVIENSSYNNSVNVTLNATDNPGGSGVNETFYMVNGGPTTTYSAPFVVDTIGPDNITYWSTDNKGNIESQNIVNFTIVEISEVNATAIRTIENKSILPGESTIITVNITGTANALAFHEIPPKGWNVTRGTDNADVFKNSTIEWVWKNMGANKTVTYTLTSPSNISIGTYEIEGTIIDAKGTLVNVTGDNSVKIDILEVYRRLGDDPIVIETMDLLKAFDDFRNNIIPEGFNRPLSAAEVDDLVNEWINS